MSRIFITGGAGFIGSHIAAHHLSQGDSVLAVDNLSTGSMANIAAFENNPRFRLQVADVVTWRGLEHEVANADRVYHMAAMVGMFHVLEHPADIVRVNVTGCERILQAASATRPSPSVVVASSSSVYGRSPPEQMREGADLVMVPGSPLLHYAVSKLANEAQAQAYARTFGVHVVAARLFNTIGPGQAGLYGYVVPRFTQQAIAGEPITVFGDGQQTRSFCDVRDMVAFLVALAETPAARGQVVNVGNAQEITIQALAELVRARAGSDSPITHVSYAKAYGRSFEQIPQRRPVLDRLHALTLVRPRWTLEATIDDLVSYYRGNTRQKPAIAMA